MNPGLGNPNGELVFVTEEPRHLVDWDEYEGWETYNEEWMPRFAEASGGRMIDRLLEQTRLNLKDVWITDSIKCPTKGDEHRGIPETETEEAFECCRAYLRRELEAIEPIGIVTLGKEATRRTLEEFGVPEWKAKRVRVTKEYGERPFDSSIPVVISLHWAQRTVEEDEWVPVIQAAIADLVESEAR
ncbi:uracil-DNA glycosylase family protein [Natrinema sp. H-ect4]|uniref:uracil-DNA glycosylase family protein n=1 Tax=Natrinema sp. H-ect4 TaxID=3242699 RepID=UPI0035A97CDF